MTKISVFQGNYISQKTGKLAISPKPSEDMGFKEYIENIEGGYWQDEVLAYRTNKIEKLALPGVTPSGVFSYRSAGNLSKHSGIIVIDIDKDDQLPSYDHNKVRLKLASDEYIRACHMSCSGDGGLAVYVKIDPSRHVDAFLALEKYFADKYHLNVDPSGKDVSRFRFVSYDPDCYFNPSSKMWRRYIPKARKEPRRHNFVFGNDDIDHVFSQISSRRLDLTDDYHDWFRIGCAISSHYGEAGRDKFHMVSSMSSKYDSKACDDLYDILLKRGNRGVEIGTFLWLAKMAGIDISSPRTQTITQITAARKQMIGKSGGYKDARAAKESAKKYLKDQQGIEGEDVDRIIDEVIKMPGQVDGSTEKDDIIPRLRAWLTTKDIKYNEVTGQNEINGEPQTDRIANSLYIEGVTVVGKKATKDLIFSMLLSNEIQSYHPLKSYFQDVEYLRPKGVIDKFLDCIKTPDTEYRDLYMRKWLLSVVASAHGTYSLMIMVFTGGQRAGKTEFFRSLLPEKLKPYYAESQLDEGKDSEILMTQKLIIVDDEFSGKSKRDYKKLKDMSSKQYFNIRKPYGKFNEDMKRYAVLAGNSNEDEIINDPTGNRRIIPMPIIDIDHDALEEIDRNELWAELYREWQEIGDGWMLTKDEVDNLNEKTEGNKQVSMEEELIQKHFEPVDESDIYAEYFTATDIKVHIENANPTVRIKLWQVGVSMKALGYTKTRKRLSGSANASNVYVVKKLMVGERSFEGEGKTDKYDEVPF